MKYLLVTDTHLGINQSSEFYHNVVLNLFKEIVQYCKDNHIDTIIHLGDFFHERKSLNTKSQHIAHKIAEILRGLEVYLIVGNHDIYFKESLIPTALEMFKNYPHIHIIDKITYWKDEKIVLCPWGLIPDNFQDGFCFGHFEFIGFKMNNNYIAEKGQDPLLVKKFWHTYSGHYHTPSINNDHAITYLGSPYQQTFADIGSDRGYYVWDREIKEFIKYKGAPVFLELKTNDLNLSNVEGNIVKLVFTENYGTLENQKIIDELLMKKPYKWKIDFSQINFEGTDEKIETADASLLDHNEIIGEYVEKNDPPEHLNKKTILKMMDEFKK